MSHSLDSDETPQDILLRRAIPVLTERIDASFQKMQVEQRQTTKEVTELNGKFHRLNETVAHAVTGNVVQSIGDCLVQTGHMLRRRGNTEESGATTVPGTYQSYQSTLESIVVAADQLHLASPSPPAGTSSLPARGIQSRKIRTVHDCWKEYNEGIGVLPSLKSLEANGPSWRSEEADSKHFRRRLPIYEYINKQLALGKRIGSLLDSLEERRIKNSWSLWKLASCLPLATNDTPQSGWNTSLQHNHYNTDP